MKSITKTLLTLGLAVLFTGSVAGPSLAQEAKPAAKAAPAGGGEESTSYKAKTVYDFDDDTVEGDLQRPDGELIDSVRKVKHSSLIEIRKDFIPEMLKSLEDV
jgi:hypothetical protein